MAGVKFKKETKKKLPTHNKNMDLLHLKLWSLLFATVKYKKVTEIVKSL